MITGAKDGSARKCVRCQKGEYLSADGTFCLKCPAGKYSMENSTQCLDCPDGMFSNKEGSGTCSECGAGTTNTIEKTGCDYNNCQYRSGKNVLYDLSPLRVDGGPMYRVKGIGREGLYSRSRYYVNVCSLKHDNTSCMTKKSVKGYYGKYKTKAITMNTLACRSVSYGTSYSRSTSFGEILHFLPLPGNETNGLQLNFRSRSISCYDQKVKKYKARQTIIQMLCDMTKGVGQPEISDNSTTGKQAPVKGCIMRLHWRSKFACRICHEEEDFKKIFGQCKNGQRQVTYIQNEGCRTIDEKPTIVVKTETCTNKASSTSPGKKNNSALIGATSASIILLLVVLLIVFVYFKRYRGEAGVKRNIFNKTFSRIQKDDEEDLVDDDVL